MQRFIKRARRFHIIDKRCTDHCIVDLYDTFYSSLIPLYKGKDPLRLSENNEINVLIDDIILDRMIAHCYRTEKGR